MCFLEDGCTGNVEVLRLSGPCNASSTPLSKDADSRRLYETLGVWSRFGLNKRFVSPFALFFMFLCFLSVFSLCFFYILCCVLLCASFPICWVRDVCVYVHVQAHKWVGKLCVFIKKSQPGRQLGRQESTQRDETDSQHKFFLLKFVHELSQRCTFAFKPCFPVGSQLTGPDWLQVRVVQGPEIVALWVQHAGDCRYVARLPFLAYPGHYLLQAGCVLAAPPPLSVGSNR